MKIKDKSLQQFNFEGSHHDRTLEDLFKEEWMLEKQKKEEKIVSKKEVGENFNPIDIDPFDEYQCRKYNLY